MHSSMHISRGRLLGLAAMAALCSGCGATVAAPLTGGGVTPPPDVQVAPPGVYGEVVQAHGMLVAVESSDGADAHFAVTPATRVTRIALSDSSALTDGACVVVGGSPRPDGSVVAVWALVEGAVGCTGTGGGLASEAAAVQMVQGTVQSVAGRVLTLHTPDGGVQKVVYTVGTAVGVVVDQGLHDLLQGSCVVGRGGRGGRGIFTATRVSIVPAPTGGCFAGAAGVGLLSFLDPQPGDGASSVPGGAAFLGPDAGTVTQGQSGVANGGPVSASSPGAVQQEPESNGVSQQQAPPMAAPPQSTGQPGPARTAEPAPASPPTSAPAPAPVVPEPPPPSEQPQPQPSQAPGHSGARPEPTEQSEPSPGP